MLAALVLVAAQAQVLTLEEAVRSAEQHQPTLRQAHANTEAAHARADEARSFLLPQVNLSAAYQRTTGNFAPRPGVIPENAGGTVGANNSWTTFNFFNFGLTLNQLIWDFGQTTDRWRASKAAAEAFSQTEQATRQQALLAVRTSFFTAQAQKALMAVAREQLANQRKHLEQIEGFVQVGTRPEIDRLTVATQVANADVQRIAAENNYETAKAQLNQAMGVEGPTDYDVADTTLPPVPGEDEPIEPLVDEAAKARPDLASLERQIRAEELTVSSAKGAYWPSLGATASATAIGVDVTDLAYNGSVGATLTWPIFQGLLTRATVSEASATLRSIEAQRDVLHQQVRLEVDQARLAVRAAKATIAAADVALQNARAQLQLAEGRYQEGLGNAIELSDAQTAYTAAEAQRVQAIYTTATARAQLLRALGRVR